MYKTKVLFAVLMVLLIGSCIYAYATLPEPIVIEEIKAEEPAKPVNSVNKAKIPAKKESYMFRFPKYGMKEKYIDETSLGKHDAVKVEYDTLDPSRVAVKVYYWKNSDGTNLAYAITNMDYTAGERIVYYFVYDGKTKSAPKKSPSSGRTSSKSTDSDPYNAKDYGYAEDFYDEYYDDFYDYEDAEDYWMEHN